MVTAYSASSGVSRISWQASETMSCRFSQLQVPGLKSVASAMVAPASRNARAGA